MIVIRIIYFVNYEVGIKFGERKMEQKEKVANLIKKLDETDPKDFRKKTNGFGDFTNFETTIKGRDVVLQSIFHPGSARQSYSMTVEHNGESDDEYPEIGELFERVCKRYDEHTQTIL